MFEIRVMFKIRDIPVFIEALVKTIRKSLNLFYLADISTILEIIGEMIKKTDYTKRQKNFVMK